jgi:isocitrate/isopropylmalate dehydrogenase
MATIAMETTKKHEKFKVLVIEWNFTEILSDMCTHNFEA